MTSCSIELQWRQGNSFLKSTKDLAVLNSFLQLCLLSSFMSHPYSCASYCFSHLSLGVVLVLYFYFSVQVELGGGVASVVLFGLLHRLIQNAAKILPFFQKKKLI